MKALRICLLVLLAVLLPVRGALAAAMWCSMGNAPAHGMSHGAAHAADHAVSHDGADHGHDHAGTHATPADKCNLCAACCTLTPLAAAMPTLAEPAAVAVVRFGEHAAPAPEFLSGGPERPPRTN